MFLNYNCHTLLDSCECNIDKQNKFGKKWYVKRVSNKLQYLFVGDCKHVSVKH